MLRPDPSLVESANAESAPVRRISRYVPFLAIAVLGVAAYSNSLHNPFILDDNRWIVEGPLIRDLRSFFFGAGYSAFPNRAVGFLTFALNYRFGGVEVLGYHLTNVAIHVVNAALVYLLVDVTFRSPVLASSGLGRARGAVALASSLVFVAHPVQTQAVTYVIQRFTSLATTFCLLALVQYGAWRIAASKPRGQLRRAAGYLAVLIWTVLAMRTKEIAVTLPVVICIYELSFFEGPWRRRAWVLGPVIATLGIIPATLLAGRGGAPLDVVAAATRVQTTLPRLDYLLTQLVVLLTYLRLLVLPVNQNLDYDFPVFRSMLSGRVIAGCLVVIGLVATASWLYHKTARRGPSPALDPAFRLVAFGIVWFLITLLPESSVIPIVDVIFEHRVYLPSIGLMISFFTLVAWLAGRLGGARSYVVTVSLGCAMAAPFAVATYLRNEVWSSELALWSDVQAKSPNKSRPHYILAGALDQVGRGTEARLHYLEAIRLGPDNPEAHYNIGVHFLKNGDSGSRDPRVIRGDPAGAREPRRSLPAREHVLVCEAAGEGGGPVPGGAEAPALVPARVLQPRRGLRGARTLRGRSGGLRGRAPAPAR